ncbi:MAG TPA: hypothetical protein VFZ78_00610, partial [Flavisolibacter sp.]
MKAASSSEIKEALRQQAHGRLVDICLRLARFKKENKELLTYILFEADDEAAYVSSVKKEMDAGFAALNKSSVYLAKKTIRKVLRTANRFTRYAGSATVEAELLLHFCYLLKHSGVQLRKSTAL